MQEVLVTLLKTSESPSLCQIPQAPLLHSTETGCSLLGPRRNIPTYLPTYQRSLVVLKHPSPSAFSMPTWSSSSDYNITQLLFPGKSKDTWGLRHHTEYFWRNRLIEGLTPTVTSLSGQAGRQVGILRRRLGCTPVKYAFRGAVRSAVAEQHVIVYYQSCI